MKKDNAMKHKVFLAAVLVSTLAFAQAPAPAPKPAAEAAKPAPAVAAEVKPAAEPKKTRRNEDARHCLEQPSNNAVIKCAEAFL